MATSNFFSLQVNDLQREVQHLHRKLGAATKEFEDLSVAGPGTDLKGKVVYDVDDPNRPRFSLPELRDILQVWGKVFIILPLLLAFSACQ